MRTGSSRRRRRDWKPLSGGNDLHDGQDDLLQNEKLMSMIMCHRQQRGREQQVHSASAERETTVDGDSLPQLIRFLMDDHQGAETERQAAEDRKVNSVD